MSPASRVLAFDVGKTGCKGALFDEDRRVAEATCPGSVGIAESNGVEAATAAVSATAGELGTGTADTVAVGLSGLGGARHKAPALAAALAQHLEFDEVVLTSDMTIAHVGALSGEPGIVVIAGTGAVALCVDATGRSSMSDGWGYLLGDDGSGFAVGRAGLASAVRHQDGRGGSAMLHRSAQARFGPLELLPSIVHGAANPPREVAAFVPDVIAAAELGDDEAVAILERAGLELARSAAGAARVFGARGVTVTTNGGLFDAATLLSDAFEVELRRRLPYARRVTPRGDALEGARLLALDRALPHSGLVTRFGAGDIVGDGSPRSGEVASELHALETEAARPDLADLDDRSTADVVSLLVDEDALIAPAVSRARDAITAAVEVVAERLRAGGRLVYVGAGTSGRLAVLDAAELLPTYGVGSDVVVALVAGGDSAVMEAAEGAEDDADAGRADIARTGVGPADVVVGISASGRTPYVLAAMQAAAEVGAATIGIANNTDSTLGRQVEHAIEVATGPEVVAGSTRMKAGTAQKLVLNTLSTAVMVKLGKVYGNRMVDMRASNEKLWRRGQRIVAEVTGAGAAEAHKVLAAADGQVKTAIVALLSGVGVDEARERLARADGRVRDAIEEAGAQ
jgi:N-acetylmuramic acid 6-phosphate etherase